MAAKAGRDEAISRHSQGAAWIATALRASRGPCFRSVSFAAGITFIVAKPDHHQAAIKSRHKQRHANEPTCRMFHLMHDAPRRLRLQAAALKGNPARAAEILIKVRDWPGMVSAEANPLTGSLILIHDNAPGRREAILSALNVRPPRAGPQRTPLYADRLGDLIVEHLVERAVRAAVEALV